ncbi:MAG: NTP transferase domain-containing protein [Actinomycetaceae bacterium]|nr:NTP transferase domain-containing protein [Actinomycetaceae bacterium]
MSVVPEAVVILAGGTAVRLGGVSKPDYKVGARRLIDIVFDELDTAGFSGIPVVVAPSKLDVRGGVRLTLEDPPHGGPLAGVAAGVAALSDLPDDAIVGLMTCDAPLSPRLWGRLCAQLREFEAAVPVSADEEAWPQFLHGCYRLGVLRSRPSARNTSIKRGFADVLAAKVPDVERFCIDVDTPEDARELAKRLGEGTA